MEVVVLSSAEEIAAEAAARVEKRVRANPALTLGLATGSTPGPLYRELGRRHRENGLSFARTRAFLLDEYVGLDPDHPEAYRNVILNDFVSLVDIPAAAVRSLDGNAADLPAECEQFEQEIRAAGGVDVQILGIGSDGHIAFNEPTSALTSRTRVEVLAQQTREDNARFFSSLEEVPVHALTQGLGTIMEADEILLIATGAQKAAAVARFVEGPISAMCPATVLQYHEKITIYVDDAAASQLQMREYYEHMYRNRIH